MSKLPAAAAADVAIAAGLSERYVREWLGAMVTAGVVEHDPVAGTYRLPAERAGADPGGESEQPGGDSQWVAVLGAVESKVVKAFTHGRRGAVLGVQAVSRGDGGGEAQRRWPGCGSDILPLVPGLVKMFERGIDVLDVGWGRAGDD